jgi:mycothiol synthase
MRDRLSGDELAAVLRIARAATESDGVAPLGEGPLLRLRDGGGALLAYEDGAVAGAAAVTGDTAELVVHPALRRRGIGRDLAVAALERPVRFWAHGELPGAVALAASLGLERFRALWKMRRPLDAPLPPLAMPPGVLLRTFRVGADEEAWLRVNARAFADHLEQGGWTRADLERREREPWFSPEGFFLAERSGELIGFHWTKVHDAVSVAREATGTSHSENPPPGERSSATGEVYVVGVDPSEHGIGLGKALTVAGLRHLTELGLAAVMLYVDESNHGAVGLYKKLGFERWSVDAMYRPTC